MRKSLWPALAGLFLSAAVAQAEPEMAGFSREDALAHSQAAIGNSLEGVELLAPDGDVVKLEDYRGKPLVISMIFTSCHHICPATTRHLREMVAKARDAVGEESFHVITVGFDTANDSPARMASFRRRNGVEDERWAFLAGDADNMARLVERLGFLYSPSARGFDHLIQSSVIDASGRLYRQVYGITFPTPHLVEPLKELVFGKPPGDSTLDYLKGRIRLFCTVYDPATDSYHIDASVFIGTAVGLIVSLVFGRVLIREWRRTLGKSE